MKEKEKESKIKNEARMEPTLSERTRPDTRLPKSRACGQGPYLRSPDHLDRSREDKVIKS